MGCETPFVQNMEKFLGIFLERIGLRKPTKTQ